MKLKGELVPIGAMQKDTVPMGLTSSVLGGRGGRAKGRNGPGTQEGRRVWWDWGTQRALHSARGWRRILALCGCWMALRSSTNTPLWPWKGLLCKATDLHDTPSAEAMPAVKVNTPCPRLVLKDFLGCEPGFQPSTLSGCSASYRSSV